MYIIYALSSPVLAAIISGIIANKVSQKIIKYILAVLLPIPFLIMASAIYYKFLYNAPDAPLPLEIFVMPVIAIPLSIFITVQKSK